MSNTNEDRFFVERRPDGTYAGTRYGAERASYTGETQGAVISEIQRKIPGATIEVERVRDTDQGGRDKWRKP